MENVLRLVSIKGDDMKLFYAANDLHNLANLVNNLSPVTATGKDKWVYILNVMVHAALEGKHSISLEKVIYQKMIDTYYTDLKNAGYKLIDDYKNDAIIISWED